MKYLAIICVSFISIACGNSSATVENGNSASRPMRAEKLQSTTVHTTEGQATPQPVNADAAAAADSAKGGRFTQGGNPIDVTEFNKAIAEAQRSMKPDPKNAEGRLKVAQAYFERGFALTEARQYAAALKDYRSALKLLPDHAESIKWEKQIIGIYEMMKKEYPKPGEEPDPLPFAKKEQ